MITASELGVSSAPAERPEGDEGPNGWRDRAQQGGQAEPAHAQREHPPLAEDVAQ
jgi:hypothetical protein